MGGQRSRAVQTQPHGAPSMSWEKPASSHQHSQGHSEGHYHLGQEAIPSPAQAASVTSGSLQLAPRTTSTAENDPFSAPPTRCTVGPPHGHVRAQSLWPAQHTCLSGWGGRAQ